MYRRFLVLLSGLLVALSVTAQEQEQITAEEFLASLNFQKGAITLPGGVASLDLPEGFHYLSPEDTESVLVTAWGNPPGNETLGMLLQSPGDILADESWAVVIAYEEDGYVSDENADSIDYAEMLEDMQAGSRDTNAARVEAGYEEVEHRNTGHECDDPAQFAAGFSTDGHKLKNSYVKCLFNPVNNR